jgi:transposase-like protein
LIRNSRLKSGGEIKNVGRPLKFTPERRAAIIDAISQRIPYEFAAEANGICEATLYDWLNTARQHQLAGIDSEYTKFSELIKKAELNKILIHNNNIANHTEKWQGDAWILERRWHRHYSSNAQLNELNNRLSKIEGETNGKEKDAQENE